MHQGTWAQGQDKVDNERPGFRHDTRVIQRVHWRRRDPSQMSVMSASSVPLPLRAVELTAESPVPPGGGGTSA